MDYQPFACYGDSADKVYDHLMSLLALNQLHGTVLNVDDKGFTVGVFYDSDKQPKVQTVLDHWLDPITQGH